MATGTACEFAIPLRVLGPGPLTLRVSVEREDRSIEQYLFDIDLPSDDVYAQRWRV